MKLFETSPNWTNVYYFSDDHGYVVEPACGVSLAVVYENLLPRVLEEEGYSSGDGPIVIVVCGGSDLTPDSLLQLRTDFGLEKIGA
jgi:L-serine/L-threonine ammonia-lyase